MLAQPFPWQTSLWQDWQLLLAKQPLPHALLLSGPKGIGKLNLAQALANLLLCQQPKQGLACAECAACQLLTSGFHPDFYQVETEEKSKYIRIEQIRELNANLQKSAQLGGYKVVVLNPAESLNINAANALLKTLEEPEPNTQFILVSHQPSALPATIKSRCQNWQLSKPANQQALDWLTSQLSPKQLENTSAQVLLNAAFGLPLAALNLAKPEVENQRQLLAATTLKVLQGANPLQEAKQLKNIEIETLLNWLQTAIAASLKLVITGEKHLADTRQLEVYTLLAARFTPKKLLELDQFIRQKKQFLNSNPNTELLIENLMLKLYR